MKGSRMVTGIDIGSFRTSAVMAEWNAGSPPRIVGVGTSPSQGVRKGNLVDMDSAAESIRTAVDKAERMSGFRARAAVVGVSGLHTSSSLNSAMITTGGSPREICQEDVDRVINAAKNVSVPAGYGILHVLPREFIVDGYGGVNEPVGMTAARLETRATVVSCSLNLIQNIIGCMKLAGLELEDLVVNPLASGEAVLSPEEREIGTVVVDIGSAVTDYAVFREGTLWGLRGIPVGGGHITNDMAIGLQIPVASAEELKVRSHAADRPEEQPNPKTPEAPTPKEIIEARVEEIFSLVRLELERSGLYRLIPGGAVLCGGTALLDGVDEIARKAMELPVRKGIPGGVSGLADVVADPSMATCVGLIHCAVREFERDSAFRREKSQFTGALFRIRQWLSGLFA